MALLTFGRTPKFELVTPKQFVWYRDLGVASSVTATLYAGQMLQMDYTNRNLKGAASGTGSAPLCVIVTDTNRTDVEFADGVTFIDNANSFIGKVHSDLVSGTPTVGSSVVWDGVNSLYLQSASASELKWRVVATVEGVVGSWYTLRYLPAHEQHLCTSAASGNSEADWA